MICARQSVVVRVECVLVGYRLSDHIEISKKPSKIGGGGEELRSSAVFLRSRRSKARSDDITSQLLFRSPGTGARTAVEHVNLWRWEGENSTC